MSLPGKKPIKVYTPAMESIGDDKPEKEQKSIAQTYTEEKDFIGPIQKKSKRTIRKRKTIKDNK